MFSISEFLVAHRRSPLGIDEIKPRFSWILVSDKQDVMQTAYQISICTDFGAVWETGRVENYQSVAIVYDGAALQPQTLYTATVQVWANTGETAATQTAFETGMMDNTKFTAKWITATLPNEETACPVFVKKFNIHKQVVKGRLYASACGIYDVMLNEKKVGNIFLHRVGRTIKNISNTNHTILHPC